LRQSRPSGGFAAKDPNLSAPSFYAGLQPVTQFRRISDRSLYTPVPADWTLALTDVIASTKAIKDGQYREVNRAGAIAIMALSNMFSDLDLPFMFGGDGVVFVLPPHYVAQAQDVLADTRRLVKDAFGLSLRVAFVPVADLLQRGHQLSVAKFEVSRLYNQAMFAGDGIEAADQLLKDAGGAYLLPDSHPMKGIADFSGFNCRWKNIKSPRGETLSLIVRPRRDDPAVLDRLLDEIARISGDENAYHPLSAGTMEMAGGEGVAVEARVTAGRGLRYWLARVGLTFKLGIGAYLIEHKVRGKVTVNGYDLVDVRENMIAASDYRKFDGTLKMVLACTSDGRKKIVACLDRARQMGDVDYGMHLSDRALITCLINEGTSREVHFIDADGGGYALAAAMLKAGR
jgi:hypothetical protein